MTHQISDSDRDFRRALESCEIGPDDFGHRAHVRLAYVYLCSLDSAAATARMKASLLAFLQHVGADPKKYHETITAAWIKAVWHFMCESDDCRSADEFIDRNPVLLDSRIMLSHYSAEVLFSSEARQRFVEPDIEPIPEH